MVAWLTIQFDICFLQLDIYLSDDGDHLDGYGDSFWVRHWVSSLTMFRQSCVVGQLLSRPNVWKCHVGDTDSFWLCPFWTIIGATLVVTVSKLSLLWQFPSLSLLWQFWVFHFWTISRDSTVSMSLLTVSSYDTDSYEYVTVVICDSVSLSLTDYVTVCDNVWVRHFVTLAVFWWTVSSYDTDISK